MQSFCQQSFKKIRIKKNCAEPVSRKISTLIEKRNKLVTNDSPTDEIEEIYNSITEREAARNREKVLKHFKYYSENPERIQMQKCGKH